MPIQALFEGIIAALGAIAVELSLPVFGLILSETSLAYLLFMASAEEIIKYAFIYNHYLKLTIKEKILSSACFFGLGFATVDVATKKLSHAENILIPTIGIFFVHLITSMLLGLFFKKMNPQKSSLGILLLGLNILMHLSYNLLILSYF